MLHIARAYISFRIFLIKCAMWNNKWGDFAKRQLSVYLRGPLCCDNGSIVHWRTVQSKMRSEVQRNARLAPKPSLVFYSVCVYYLASTTLTIALLLSRLEWPPPLAPPLVQQPFTCWRSRAENVISMKRATSWHRGATAHPDLYYFFVIL